MTAQAEHKDLPATGRAPAECFLTANQALTTLVGLLLCLTCFAPALWAEQPKRLFRIGTGGLTGVYYPIGKLIAQGLTDYAGVKGESGSGPQEMAGTIGVAQNSAGSVENVRAVVSGEIEAGLVQADVAAWAFQGERMFAGDERVREVRAVASLYPEFLQIVVQRDAPIRSVPDLRKKRISLDEVGSGTLSVMQIVLEAHGMSEKDLMPVYLKPVFTHEKMVSGELQGFAIMGGVPAKAVSVLSDIGLTLIPIAPEVVSQIQARFPYLVPGKIPAKVYPGVPETPTLQVHALLLVSAGASEAMVHQMTSALWSERTLSLLKEGHPQGAAVSLETALEGISIPLHPGAERFYRERDMLPNRNPSP